MWIVAARNSFVLALLCWSSWVKKAEASGERKCLLLAYSSCGLMTYDQEVPALTLLHNTSTWNPAHASYENIYCQLYSMQEVPDLNIHFLRKIKHHPIIRRLYFQYFKMSSTHNIKMSEMSNTTKLSVWMSSTSTVRVFHWPFWMLDVVSRLQRAVLLWRSLGLAAQEFAVVAGCSHH